VPGDSYEFTEDVADNTPPVVTTDIVNEGGKDVKHKAGKEVYFQASATDANGDSLTYLWDFGDGTPSSTQENPSHIYTEAGTYTVTLTVTDVRGDAITDTFAVQVTKPKEGGDSPGFGAIVALAALMAVIVAFSRRRL
jgi:PGF-CTERM protein